MIALIEALNFRCLRYVRQPLGPFHVLVGPNASGKTTFLDVVSFLGQLLSQGLEAAIEGRTTDFRDLVWSREDAKIELAIEATFPEELRRILPPIGFNTVRYEVAIGPDPPSNEVVIHAENVLLKKAEPVEEKQRALFPQATLPPNTCLTSKGRRDRRMIATKVRGGNDNFYSEVSEGAGKEWMPSFKLGPKRSTLANLPEDESRFPAATWLKSLLTTGVEQVILNSTLMRKASPPGARLRVFKTDGSNLPWVINRLYETDIDRFHDWVAHVRTALPDLVGIRTVERPDDRHRYLAIKYEGGLEIPSWVASDGTLRLLALTLPAYLRDFTGVYLIEEPENGIHPQAVETMIQSVSSVYDAQILLATHSPVILSTVKPESILCFARNRDGATDIVLGSEHPALRYWKGEENLSVLFAAGILG